MPNWCSTTYKIVGDSKDLNALKKTLDKMNRRRKNPKHKNGFGPMWLGELIIELGYNWEEYRCRGEIVYYEYDQEVLTIYQETAWCEQEGVRQVIQLKYPSLSVFYQAEEPGCEVFIKNDPEGLYFPDNYYLDCDEEPEYFETIESAAERVGEIVGHKVEPTVKNIQKALDDYSEARAENGEDDVWYSFHEFEIVEY